MFNHEAWELLFFAFQGSCVPDAESDVGLDFPHSVHRLDKLRRRTEWKPWDFK